MTILCNVKKNSSLVSATVKMRKISTDPEVRKEFNLHDCEVGRESTN